MNKKPHKVGEPKSAYAAKKPVPAVTKTDQPGQTRYMDDTTFKKASAKVFKVHHELFRKLAQ